nr:MAG TPA: hypothetical protein [Caudoviricetes sp.]
MYFMWFQWANNVCLMKFNIYLQNLLWIPPRI